MRKSPPKPVAVTLPDELLPKIARRVGELDLNRSQYFRRLVREDLERAAQEDLEVDQ